jgi:outer membrane protein
MLGPLALITGLAFAQGTPSWDANSIYQRALQVSPAATSSLQSVVQAQQHVAEMNAQRRLQLSLNLNASNNHGTESFDPTSTSFQTYIGTLSLPLPNGGRIRSQVAQADAQLKVAQAGLSKTRLDLAFRSSDAYFGVLRARGAEQIAEQTLEQAKRQVADAQKRVSAGDIAPSEVLKSQVPESQAKAALAKSKSAVRIAEETLDSLVHEDLTQVPTVAEVAATLPIDLTLEQAHQLARKNSPDVIQADANVALAEGALSEAKRSRDPGLTLQAAHAHTTDPTTYANLTTLSVSFDLPLTDGGVARRQINQADAALKQAKAARDTALQDLDLAVEQAYLDVQTGMSNLTSTQETLKIAQDSYQKAVEAYNAGLTTTRDVLDAGVALAQAKSDANDALYDLALARARLDQVMGIEPKP